tara:strand:+ start:779 stop:1012 length:234 start_codon:yes stop_codon:yes gene_type:complete
MGDNMTFGKWLKIKLKKNNIQQKEIAKQICVSENTVTSWTTNVREPGIRNFIWVCKYISIVEKTTEQEIYMEASNCF